MNDTNNKIISLTSGLHTAHLDNQRIFLRADLNVPLNNGIIVDDFRLEALRATIDLIHQKNGSIILATHIGRPKGVDDALSTRHLIPWFTKHGYAVQFEPDLQKAREASHNLKKTILLLENMRFFPGEKNHDAAFVNQLADCADYYVNDAFALLHRTDASITQLPDQFDSKHKAIGLLIEKELHMLNMLFTKPTTPFVLILGGGKVADKLPLLYALIDHIDTVLLGPAIVFTFLHAQNKPVGLSLVDESNYAACMQFLRDAAQKNITIKMPLDYQIAEKTFTGPLSYTDAHNFPADSIGVSIGSRTAARWTSIIEHAGTIFYNGLMGDVKRPETLQGVKMIFEAMKRSPGTSIIGGGDSVAAARYLQLDDAVDFLSTGGGATLAYLIGQNLPGLESFR
jgi:phosphoglycerate kinase